MTMDKPNKELLLWYNKPALEWVEALPIGNGRLGAMIFGDPSQEHVQINEDTIWRGKPHDYAHEGAHNYLEEIRRLLFEGKQREAEVLAAEEFMSVPLYQKAYQPFCDLQLDFQFDQEEVTDYHRYLDLEQAVAGVTFAHKNVNYRREYLASNPDQSIWIHCDADQKGMVNFQVALTSPHQECKISESGNSLNLEGEVEADGIRFAARLVVNSEGGQVFAEEVDGQWCIKVKNADEATIIFVGASSFINFRDISGDPVADCTSYMDGLPEMSYQKIRNNHIEDYSQLFSSVEFSLGNELIDLPTDQRLKNYNIAQDPQLAVLYLQYGRYLMVSGSRPGTTALNLQGIWNDSLHPAWDSKYTCNINLEMNYWLAEPANLAACHQPLFNLLKVVSETGRRVATEHYNCRGWVLHHNTDIWGGTAPINASDHGIWPTGGAWLCEHIWKHYLYHQDLEFLQEYYPIMREAALFFIDFLVEDPETGWLISTPSNSPEIGGLVAGPTMDHQIIRSLFKNCIEAGQVLNLDSDLGKELTAKVERIAPNKIGRHGQLQEWMADLDNPNEKHRHVSHLWGLHPGNEISPSLDRKFSDAARQTLEHRGDQGTGWSMAWKINFWARLQDGERAAKLFETLISEGTYPNLFDAHPPFQIDGNFGAAAGVIEMFVQSHLGYTQFLPALPKTFLQGSISGIRVEGGFTVDLTWDSGELTLATITSHSGKDFKFASDLPLAVYDQNDAQIKVNVANEINSFATEQGRKYLLKA